MVTELLIRSQVLVLLTITSYQPVIAQGASNSRQEGTELPRIVAAEPTWDFGEAFERDVLVHQFAIRNAGTATLSINDVHASCGCTAALPEKTTLEPNEETTIKVDLKVPARAGMIAKQITVKSNDPSSPVVTLVVRGRVLSAIYTEPPEILLGDLPKGYETRRVPFSVIITPGHASEIAGLVASSPRVQVNLISKDPTVKPDGSQVYRLKATFESGHRVGEVKEKIVLQTSPGRDVVLPVSGNVIGEVSIVPGITSLGDVKRDVGAEGSMMIEKKGEGNLSIARVDVLDPKNFFAEAESLEAGTCYRLRIGARPGAPLGIRRVKVTVHTNCPGEEELIAYFYVHVVR